MTETAYAKINLALHVRKRREDGFHELETLFAFVDQGDVVSAVSANEDRLVVGGEFAQALDNPFDNLVMRALVRLPRAGGLSLQLEKNLPVAAGLGGGSADAGAVFRIVRARHGLPDDWPSIAASLGADVPACVESRTCIGRGNGSVLTRHDDSLGGTAVLLVNPRIALSTGPVFARWDGTDLGPLPDGDSCTIASEGRNDLEAPAIALVPEIVRVLGELADTGAVLSRMSGSGATCFALYEDPQARDAAAQHIAGSHPAWWMMKGSLR